LRAVLRRSPMANKTLRTRQKAVFRGAPVPRPQPPRPAAPASAKRRGRSTSVTTTRAKKILADGED